MFIDTSHESYQVVLMTFTTNPLKKVGGTRSISGEAVFFVLFFCCLSQRRTPRPFQGSLSSFQSFKITHTQFVHLCRFLLKSLVRWSERETTRIEAEGERQITSHCSEDKGEMVRPCGLKRRSVSLFVLHVGV